MDVWGLGGIFIGDASFRSGTIDSGLALDFGLLAGEWGL